MWLQWVCLLLFIAYFVGFETVWGLTSFRKALADIIAHRQSRIRLYRQMMAELWGPALVVLALVLFGLFDAGAIGLGWLRPAGQLWVVIVAAVLAGLYFAYLVYSLVVLIRNAARKQDLGQKFPAEVEAMLPVTRQEKQVWAATAVTAGFAEELLYRGFLFHLLGVLFPVLPPFAVLGISTVLFGLGHIYQGLAEAVKPMLLGLLYGFIYLAFGTIWPCVVLHALQDLCATWVINQTAPQA